MFVELLFFCFSLALSHSIAYSFVRIHSLAVPQCSAYHRGIICIYAIICIGLDHKPIQKLFVRTNISIEQNAFLIDQLPEFDNLIISGSMRKNEMNGISAKGTKPSIFP